MSCNFNLARQVDIFPIKVGVLTGSYNLTPIDPITGLPDTLVPVIDSAQAVRRKQNKCKSCQPCKCLSKKFLKCNICDC